MSYPLSSQSGSHPESLCCRRWDQECIDGQKWVRNPEFHHEHATAFRIRYPENDETVYRIGGGEHGRGEKEGPVRPLRTSARESRQALCPLRRSSYEPLHQKEKPLAQGLLEGEPSGCGVLFGLRIADRISGIGAAVAVAILLAGPALILRRCRLARPIRERDR